MKQRPHNPFSIMRHQTKSERFAREKMMRRSLWIIAVVFVASLAPTVRADAITYTINTNIAGDILTGTITTDGHLGQLTAGDITAYSLSDSLNLLGTTRTLSNSTFISPPSTIIDLVGTSTQLLAQNNFTPFQFTAGGGVGLTIEPQGLGGSIIQNSSVAVSAGILSPVIGVAVPEINSATAPSALALVAGAVLIIRGRRKVPTPLA